MLVVVAALATALAQVLLKKASYYEIQTMEWFVYMGISAFTFTLSFVLYSRILKYFALNRISPAMTVGQITIVIDRELPQHPGPLRDDDADPGWSAIAARQRLGR